MPLKLTRAGVIWIIALLQCPVNLYAQYNEIIGNLEEYNRKTISEQVFLHIDRDIFFPGDTLWFKAYIRNKASLYKKSFSRDLFVYLVNHDGNVMQKSRFLIADSGVKGQLELSEHLTEGNYYVVAWTSWMKNFNVQEVFRKRIQVKYLRKDSYHLMPNFSKKEYFPGDTVYMEINCRDNLLREVENVEFSYRITAGDKILLRGNANAFNSYKKQLNFVLPDDIQEPCELNVYGSHKKVELDKEFEVPVHFRVHVGFFPEGGYALNGLMNRIAFKAVYPNGVPAEIEGKIVDGTGKDITAVATEHEGMGLFTCIPQKDVEYYLEITKPKRIDKKFKLPKGKEQGWHLNVRNNQDKIYAEIQMRNNKTDTCLLTLMIRGYLFYSKVVPVQKKAGVVIPADTLPSGIGVITLFNKELQPCAERLVFVNYRRQQEGTLTTEAEKYLTRGRVTLNIKIDGDNEKPFKGEYSLAVVDEKLGLSESYNQSNISSSFYFSPEIKGAVINPQHYFNTGSSREKHHLDLLLMTQGWRNYQYMEDAKNIDSIPNPVNYNLVSGKILKKRGVLNPVPAPGHLKVYFGGITHHVPTDEQGNFSFLPVVDSGVNPNLFISAFDEKGNDNVMIQMESDGFTEKLERYLPAMIDSMYETYVPPVHTYESTEKMLEWIGPNHFLIAPVTVTARGRWKDRGDIEKKVIADMTDQYKKQANITFVENSRDVYDIIFDMGLNVRFNPDTDSLEYCYWGAIEDCWIPVLWYVDGLPYLWDPRDIYTKAIKDLYFLIGDKPKMLFNNAAVCYITTDSTKYSSSLLAYNRSNTKVLPRYTFTKEFYKPVYDTPERINSSVTDMRKTIHWEPEVKPDSTGRVEVTFYNSDQVSSVKCILQGISDKGIPVYAETKYEVTFQEEGDSSLTD